MQSAGFTISILEILSQIEDELMKERCKRYPGRKEQAAEDLTGQGADQSFRT